MVRTYMCQTCKDIFDISDDEGLAKKREHDNLNPDHKKYNVYDGFFLVGESGRS